jgi:signal transduction histidine kinase
MGDFRPDPRRHGIPELDRVSDVLDSATVEIAGRLQREHVLAADVSHQLRSRLTAVRLRLDELSAHPDPAVVDEAEAAMAQVDRLTAAIDDLVRASRANGSSDRTPIPVREELASVLGEWERPFAEASRRLVLDGDERLRAPVTGSRLREAVAVLVDNALVHGGGDCTVTVRDTGLGDGEANICVEVADEGRGVSDELAPHIFDRGFSGAGSTGVGLALARALVEADGGRLELRRRKPALFAIFLPSVADSPGVAYAGTGEPR